MKKLFSSVATRNARRLERIRYWDRPIRGRTARARAWISMLISDYGLFRALVPNTHPVGSGRLWRSAQPSPGQIADFKRKGVRTIVCLRGQREHGSWQLQREACEEHGLKLVELVVRSREAPDRETIRQAESLFRTMAYPAVIHCKSGADRAGFISALYLVLVEQIPVSEAVKQLSLRFGHFRFSKTGILDAFFTLYLEDSAATDMPFRQWMVSVYDPVRLTKRFKTKFLHRLLSDGILRRE